MKAVRTLSTLAVIALAASACSSAGPGPSPTGRATIPRGGTLRVVIPEFPSSALAAPEPDPSTLDPQFPAFYDSQQVERCCLTRTLVSYPGRPTDEGGAELQPDLAAALPEVSADGLTWTFRLKPGLRYAPPLADTEITAQDFVRAIERTARIEKDAFGEPFTYTAVQGFTAFGNGTATSIPGLEAPDDHTLLVRLDRPAGDLGARLALSAASPIPPDPRDPSAPFGVATGHDGTYGQFLVATGPYMIEGSGDLDFSLPAADQRPVAGLRLSTSLALVRNPSWTPGSDALRAAYPDRIEVTMGGTAKEAQAEIEAGRADLVLHAAAPPQVAPEDVQRYRADPFLGTVDVHFRDFVRYISMNVAQPPFDDLHVRKAMNFVIDKRALIDGRGGPDVGQPAGHIVLDSLEDNQLVAYDPYRTPNGAGSLSLAREEMTKSRYDHDGDGICDDPACTGIRALVLALPLPGAEGQGALVARSARSIGIHLRLEDHYADFFALALDPTQHVGVGINPGFGKDLLNASGMIPGLFAGASINSSGSNQTLVGATNRQLARWGYDARDVPSVDGRLDECLGLIGADQTRCWAALDQYLMEQVVPWVPIMFEHHVELVPSRIAHYSFDQQTALPELEQIALRP